MQTITETYLLGVREGRAALKTLLAHGFSHADAIRHGLESCKGVAALGFGGEMAEYNRGERAFWRGQVKIRADLKRAARAMMA